MKKVEVMPSVAEALKGEIKRISRKEVRSAIEGLEKSNHNLKKTVIDLKKRVASLEKENKFLTKETRIVKAEPPEEEHGDGRKGRLTSKGIRNLRSKLHLTQTDFAKLVGASPQSVHLWENKEGTLNLRDQTKESILSIKGLGAKEARAELEQIEGKKG
jgi:DNA-binding transcriptional regulator YiaG